MEENLNKQRKVNLAKTNHAANSSIGFKLMNGVYSPKRAFINSEIYSNPERIGLVEHVKADSEPPTNGWTSYKARVLCVNGNSLLFSNG